ncbi:MAG: pantoate--beta-alanine ligase [gamma proteobacterium symbiont of Bathyaustriella thionipta]|nr:pantoate--beta-alanine ligase [gamma proteobacterium symbiont of Bathyaustriella thionipta]
MSLPVTADCDEVRQQVSDWKRSGERVAFVPTMGNLHEGHLQLVRAARKSAGRVLVSIFVNPLQFDNADDLSAYPRTLKQDADALAALHVDLLYTPSAQSIYPQGLEQHTRVTVPRLGDILCGAHREGHFAGVSTIVCKLFNQVQPHTAVFGEKDFQQLALIRKMVTDLAMPIKIIGVPTMREADGLAMSSRNLYLSDSERQQATKLYQVLQKVRSALLNDDQDYDGLQKTAIASLQNAAIYPEYVEILRQSDLHKARPQQDSKLVIVVAAKVGKARLIDNLQVNLNESPSP